MLGDVDQKLIEARWRDTRRAVLKSKRSAYDVDFTLFRGRLWSEPMMRCIVEMLKLLYKYVILAEENLQA